jgi:hypothetical protein
MQALTANYLPSSIDSKKEQFILSSFGTSYREKFSSPSLFVIIDTPYHNIPKLNDRIFDLLEEFTFLEHNWDEEDALSPDSVAVSNATYIAQCLERGGQSIYNAAPGPNGEVMLDLRNIEGTRSVELIFYSNRSIIVYYPETDNPYQDNFSFEELPSVLEWLNRK